MSGDLENLGADEDARKTESHMVQENPRLRNDGEIHGRPPKKEERPRQP
jgi:hypothetical protein